MENFDKFSTSKKWGEKEKKRKEKKTYLLLSLQGLHLNQISEI